jgi:hypothetical protein
MDVEFFAADPRKKARPDLEHVLRNGTDQLAIACAFCTAAGVKLLLQHTARLAKPDSFVVVAAAPPTDYPELSRLHSVIPSSLFVHWGASAPFEIKNGAALMHSKVFYARAGRECWLWTGSHNLTGNATQGGNCEAAVLLHGTADERPFVDALQHLLACRNEATLYDPDAPPPGGAQKADILVIHAEADPLPPVGPLPWRIHLCLNSAVFDELLTAPADVRLFVYPSGALMRGWQNATPRAAYSGSLTGQNLTGQNPRARRAGTPAEWSAANFGIVQSGQVLVMGPVAPPSASVTTQAVLYVDRQSDPQESLFSEEPRVEVELVRGEQRWTPVDSDMLQFFRKKHIHGSSILHVPFTGRRQVIRVPEDEAREADFEKIQTEIGANRNIPIESVVRSEAKMMKRHPFIIRAKYRLPDAT